MQPQALLFDHDGTLVDSEPTHYLIWRDILAPHGVALTEAQYKAHYAGLPTAANAADVVTRFSLARPAAELALEKNDRTKAYLEHSAFPLMPGAREVLERFHARGVRMGIVTGAKQFGVQATLRSHGLAGYFGTVVSSEEVKRGKPAPEGYLLAMKTLGADPAATFAIEDTGHGVIAAADAGIACIAVPNEMSRHHDFSRAAVVVGSLEEAADWIEGR